MSAEITEVNGQMCLVHVIQPSNSLLSISMMYNVDMQHIKAANGLPGDVISHNKTLNIPMTETFKAPSAEALSPEEVRRKTAITEMNSHMGQAQGMPGGDFTEQATFYCEENDYDIGKAKQAFDRDRAFEEAQYRGNQIY